MKLEFSQQSVEKNSNIKFHQNPSGGNRVLPRGRTEGQENMAKLKSRFSQFCEKRLNIHVTRHDKIQIS